MKKMKFWKAKRSIIKAGRRLWLKGIFSGTDGNMSLRVGDVFLITASGVSKGFLKLKDFGMVDIKTGEVRGNVSSEYRMHLQIYRKTEANAVVHAHPPFATALSCIKKINGISVDGKIDVSLLVESMLFLSGKPNLRAELKEGAFMPLVAFEPASSWELAEAVSDRLASSGSKVALMACHGAVATGSSLEEAVNLMELIENFSNVFLRTVRDAEFYSRFYEASRDPHEALKKMLEVREKLWNS